MSQDKIKKLAEAVKNHAPKKPRASKSNRTMALSEPQFSTFQAYCKSKGMTTSQVVDNLIEIFLNEVKDDLPIDLTDRAV